MGVIRLGSDLQVLYVDLINVFMRVRDHKELDILIRFVVNGRPVLHEKFDLVLAARDMGLNVGFVGINDEGSSG